MLYQLVLITNLGVVTPLATFPDYQACIKERSITSNTAQYSLACLPTESPEQLQKRLDAGMKMMVDTIKKFNNELN